MRRLSQEMPAPKETVEKCLPKPAASAEDGRVCGRVRGSGAIKVGEFYEDHFCGNARVCRAESHGGGGKNFPLPPCSRSRTGRRGRKHLLTPSPVKQAALARGIPVLQPVRLREDLSALRAVGADLMVTCAYGQILTQETLDLFPMGVVERPCEPAAQIPRGGTYFGSHSCGERRTGVTIMRTDAGLDTGDMFSKRLCRSRKRTPAARSPKSSLCSGRTCWARRWSASRAGTSS